MILPSLFFVLSVVLFAAWSILDGFDLGIGTLFLFLKGERERDDAVRAIGPVWNGNEVWLIAAVGSIFVVFPPVYGALLGGLYLPAILFLLSIVGRDVALEMRSRVKGRAARSACGLLFALGSALIAFLVGVVAANVLRGLPLDAAGSIAGPGLRLFSPYAMAAGAASLCGFALHGAAWLALKADGSIRAQARALFSGLAPGFLLLAAATLVLGAFAAPRAMPWAGARALPWILGALAFGAGAGAWAANARAGRLLVFLLTSLLMATIVAWLASTLFPVILPSSIDRANDMTIANAAVGERSLRTLLVLAIIGVPIALAVNVLLYRVFRGEQKGDVGEY